MRHAVRVQAWILEVNNCPINYSFSEDEWGALLKILTHPSGLWLRMRGCDVSWAVHAGLSEAAVVLLLNRCRKQWSTQFLKSIGIYFNETRQMHSAREGGLYFNSGFAPPLVDEDHERGGRVGAVLSGGLTRAGEMDVAPALLITPLKVSSPHGSRTAGSSSATTVAAAVSAIDVDVPTPPKRKAKVTPRARLERQFEEAATSDNYARVRSSKAGKAKGKDWGHKHERKRHWWSVHLREALYAQRADGRAAASVRGTFTVLLSLATFLFAVPKAISSVLCGMRYTLSREWSRAECNRRADAYKEEGWADFLARGTGRTVAYFADNYGKCLRACCARRARSISHSPAPHCLQLSLAYARRPRKRATASRIRSPPSPSWRARSTACSRARRGGRRATSRWANCCVLNGVFIEYHNCAISMMLPRTDVSAEFVRRRSVLRPLKSAAIERLFHSLGLKLPGDSGGRQQQEHKAPLVPRFAKTRRSMLAFFASEFEKALDGHPDVAATVVENVELAALRGELEVTMRGKKKKWGFEEALKTRTAYHERLRNGGRARAALAGDAALSVKQLREEVAKLGAVLPRGYTKRAELLLLLKGARSKAASLLVQRVRRQTERGAAACEQRSAKGPAGAKAKQAKQARAKSKKK